MQENRCLRRKRHCCAGKQTSAQETPLLCRKTERHARETPLLRRKTNVCAGNAIAVQENERLRRKRHCCAGKRTSAQETPFAAQENRRLRRKRHCCAGKANVCAGSTSFSVQKVTRQLLIRHSLDGCVRDSVEVRVSAADSRTRSGDAPTNVLAALNSWTCEPDPPRGAPSGRLLLQTQLLLLHGSHLNGFL